MAAQTERVANEPVAHEIFQALADDTRLRCLMLLSTHGELCVCELVHALELSQPKISRHLKLLRNAGVLADRRERIWVYYRIREQLPAWIGDVINSTWQANAQREPFISDTQRLATMADRPGDRCPG